MAVPDPQGFGGAWLLDQRNPRKVAGRTDIRAGARGALMTASPAHERPDARQSPAFRRRSIALKREAARGCAARGRRTSGEDAELSATRASTATCPLAEAGVRGATCRRRARFERLAMAHLVPRSADQADWGEVRPFARTGAPIDSRD